MGASAAYAHSVNAFNLRDAIEKTRGKAEIRIALVYGGPNESVGLLIASLFRGLTGHIDIRASSDVTVQTPSRPS